MKIVLDNAMVVSSGEEEGGEGNSTKTQATSLNLFDSGNNKNKKR